jgi:hypothetical protein
MLSHVTAACCHLPHGALAHAPSPMAHHQLFPLTNIVGGDLSVKGVVVDKSYYKTFNLKNGKQNIQ